MIKFRPSNRGRRAPAVPRWSRSDRIAALALAVAIVPFLYTLYRDFLHHEPVRRALSATVSAFDYSMESAETVLVADILLQNLGNRPEIVRSMNFVLPFDATSFSTGEYWYVPADFRFGVDFERGVGKCWPADTLGVIANLHLAPGEVVLKQLRQPASEARIVDFLRGNESRIGAGDQLIAIEFVVADVVAGSRAFVAPVASVSLDGDWRRDEWVRVDLSGPDSAIGPPGPLAGPRKVATGEVSP